MEPEYVNSIPHKDNVLLTSLKRFYQIPENVNTFLSIIGSNTVLSLRILDWLVTNYAKKNSIVYTIDNMEGKVNIFNIHMRYKNELKGCSKQLFDPFCRRKRIRFVPTTVKFYPMEITDEEIVSKSVDTTVGQLNFFRWAIENKIIEYAIKNLKDIEDDMLRSMSNRYCKKGNKTSESGDSEESSGDSGTNSPVSPPGSPDSKKRIRSELSKSASKTLKCHDIKIIMDFS